MTLKDLQKGDRAEVVGFGDGSRGYKRRVLALGLTPGAKFTVKNIAPLGDPVKVELMGNSLSLRKEEAEIMEVKKI